VLAIGGVCPRRPLHRARGLLHAKLTEGLSRRRLSALAFVVAPAFARWVPTLYFDFISPYAYLAWAALRARAVTVSLQPVLFAGILAHHGQLGPAEIPAKRAWLVRDTMRQAQRHGVPFRFPASHPFRPLTALRVSLPAIAREQQADVVATLFELGWRYGGDLGDDEAIARALDGAGLDAAALLGAASAAAAKEQLRQATADAIDAGVFGVPTLALDGELFWGADRLDDALDHQRGLLRLDEEAVQAALRIPAAATRKR
jgi:2-hydroxychromene-2-carboxylate isomerase